MLFKNKYEFDSSFKSLDFSYKKVCIIISLWNSNITKKLEKKTIETLLILGFLEKNIKKIYVPGSFELIYAAKRVASCMNTYNGIIAIGCIIKGDTYHFDYVCQAVSQGIKDINIRYNTPCIFCVLTDNNMQQSIDRSSHDYNKGEEAAYALARMIFIDESLTSN